MNILIFGLGYVGYSNFHFFQKNIFNIKCDVTDIDKNKINKLLNKESIFEEKNDFKILGNKKNVIYYDKLNVKKYDFFILALPTNEKENGDLDTSIIENQIKKIRKISNKEIIIRSTLPIGFTDKMDKKYTNIIFMPEFISEANLIKDELNPFVTIIGANKKTNNFKIFLSFYRKIKENNSKILFVKPKEAEMIKLSNNSFLALRISYINELLMLSEKHSLKIENILNALSENPIIGKKYLKVSSGFGGYCLPKDSKNLSNEFKKVNLDNHIIKNINNSNEYRKNYIIEKIINSGIKEILFNGIGFNFGKGNIRNSSRMFIAKKLSEKNIKVEVIDENITRKNIGKIKFVKTSKIKYNFDFFVK